MYEVGSNKICVGLKGFWNEYVKYGEEFEVLK